MRHLRKPQSKAWARERARAHSRATARPRGATSVPVSAPTIPALHTHSARMQRARSFVAHSSVRAVPALSGRATTSGAAARRSRSGPRDFKSDIVMLEVELMERLQAVKGAWKNEMHATGSNNGKVEADIALACSCLGGPLDWALQRLSESNPAQGRVLRSVRDGIKALLSAVRAGAEAPMVVHACGGLDAAACRRLHTAMASDLPSQVAADAMFCNGLSRAMAHALPPPEQSAPEVAEAQQEAACASSMSVHEEQDVVVVEPLDPASRVNAAAPPTGPSPNLLSHTLIPADVAFVAGSPISQDSTHASTTRRSRNAVNDISAGSADTVDTTLSSFDGTLASPHPPCDTAARPLSVPLLQLGPAQEQGKLQSYQEEFMQHKSEWSQSWRDEDEGVTEGIR